MNSTRRIHEHALASHHSRLEQNRTVTEGEALPHCARCIILFVAPDHDSAPPPHSLCRLQSLHDKAKFNEPKVPSVLRRAAALGIGLQLGCVTRRQQQQQHGWNRQSTFFSKVASIGLARRMSVSLERRPHDPCCCCRLRQTLARSHTQTDTHTHTHRQWQSLLPASDRVVEPPSHSPPSMLSMLSFSSMLLLSFSR